MPRIGAVRSERLLASVTEIRDCPSINHVLTLLGPEEKTMDALELRQCDKICDGRRGCCRP